MITIFVLVVFILLFTSTSGAAVVVGDPDIIIGKNEIVKHDLDTEHILYLENRGEILGDIYVCKGCDFYIQNKGAFSGTIYGGYVVQVIKSPDDIKALSVVSDGFEISVQSIQPLRVSDLINVARGADKIVLNDSVLIFDGGVMSHSLFLRNFIMSAPQKIELRGNIMLEINPKNMLGEQLLFSNVSGNGVISVMPNGLDSLYVADIVYRDGNVYLSVNRETDYRRILGGARGEFLEDLRIINPNNSLLMALDRAQDTNSFNRVVKNAIMFNPINMMRAIKKFNNFEMATPIDSGVAGIYSDDYDLYAVHIGGTVLFGKTKLSASAYAGTMESSDVLNDYSGKFYGGNIRAEYVAGLFWMREISGATYAAFDADMIFDGHGVASNPVGLSVYGAADVGAQFNIFDVYIKPFVGAVGEYDNVLFQNKTDVAGRVGANIGYDTEPVGGTNYEYSAYAVAQTNDVIMIGARIGFWSDADNAGAGLSYGISHDEFGISHRAALDVRVNF